MSASDEIAALLYVYAERVDQGDFEGVGELFAHASYRTDGVEEVLSGDAIADVMHRTVRLYDGRPRTKHVVTNVIVELDLDADPGAASARSYFTVLQAPPDQPPGVIITGRYHDRFEQVGTRWRFADRLIFIDQVGDLSHHLHLDRLGW